VTVKDGTVHQFMDGIRLQNADENRLSRLTVSVNAATIARNTANENGAPRDRGRRRVTDGVAAGRVATATPPSAQASCARRQLDVVTANPAERAVCAERNSAVRSTRRNIAPLESPQALRESLHDREADLRVLL
jgi:hypothetical protein